MIFIHILIIQKTELSNQLQKKMKVLKNDTIYFRLNRNDLILLKESIPLKVLGEFY